jgi:hypothetical protein
VAANELLTDDVIAKEALMIVENELTITKLINRRYEKKFAQEGNKIGDTLNIRLPVRWEGREGELMVPEAARERTIALKVDRLIGQDLEFSNVDLTLKVDQFKERYLDTACASIANRIDKAVCEQYANVPNFAGTPAVVPSTLDTYFDASVIMSNYGVPSGKNGKRAMVLSPRMEATIVNALKGLFQAAKAIATQYETGGMGHVIGFDWHMDQNIQTHTVGTLGGTPLVDGAGQSGASILLRGYTSAAAQRHKRGDIVTFAGVNGVNPMSKDDTGELRQFVVTADTDGTAGGAVTLPILPAIVLAGPYRNVTAAAADGAAVKTFGHASTYAAAVSKQGLAFHKEWLTAAFVDLDLPKGMEMAARAKSEKLGLSIRIVKGFDIRTNQHLCRLDVLFGLKQTYEDFAVRIAS